MADYAGLLTQCEDLYAAVCFDAAAWPDSALADWMEGLAASSQMDKEIGREVRRIVRAAQKLRDFWLAPAAGRPPDHGDWRTRVDIGLGVKAWRPLLAMARLGLSREPDGELYEDVKERFRVVTGEHWMEGVTFEEWLDRDRI